VADDIAPGVQLSMMLADILEDASSLHSLSLSNNSLDDTAVANIMRTLASNPNITLTNLDLSGNNLMAPVSVLADGWDTRRQVIGVTDLLCHSCCGNTC
jgi:hypothetical protein